MPLYYVTYLVSLRFCSLFRFVSCLFLFCLLRWEEGLQIFVDMVKAAEAPRDPGTLAPMPPVPDATTYGAAITACSRGKQWQIALRLLDDMEERVRPRSCTSPLLTPSAPHSYPCPTRTPAVPPPVSLHPSSYVLLFYFIPV